MNTYLARNITLIKALHLGFVAFGITAWLTAEGAEDGGSAGYLLHSYLGFSLAFIMLLRVLSGLTGGEPLAFAGWSPLRPSQWRLAGQDLLGLLRLRVPTRPIHQGIAGLVQAFGIALFAGMAVTGILLFILTGSGDALEAVEEVHEAGEGLIPAFLTLHAGAVVLHSLAGKPVWRRMFIWDRKDTPAAVTGDGIGAAQRRWQH